MGAYSMVLTRYCFMHIDYFKMYIHNLPKGMLDFIHKNKNCEDIAMTFLVSSMQGGQPPLLADEWAIRTQIKFHVEKKISGGSHHKDLRDSCVQTFSWMLGL